MAPPIRQGEVSKEFEEACKRLIQKGYTPFVLLQPTGTRIGVKKPRSARRPTR